MAWMLKARFIRFLLPCLVPLAVLATASAERFTNAAYAVSVDTPSNWKVEDASSDPTIAVCLTRPEDRAYFALRVFPGSPDLLKAGWVRLRYDVVVHLGGRILQDQAYRLGPWKGRVMVYATPAESGRETMFWRAHVLRKDKIYTFHLASPEASFRTNRAAMEAVARSAEYEVEPPPSETPPPESKATKTPTPESDPTAPDEPGNASPDSPRP